MCFLMLSFQREETIVRAKTNNTSRSLNGFSLCSLSPGYPSNLEKSKAVSSLSPLEACFKVQSDIFLCGLSMVSKVFQNSSF